MYIDNIGILLKVMTPNASNSNNVWNVNGNNRNVNNNNANNTSNNGVRPATFFKTMNFWTKVENEKLKKISNIPCRVGKKYVIDEKRG